MRSIGAPAGSSQRRAGDNGRASTFRRIAGVGISCLTLGLAACLHAPAMSVERVASGCRWSPTAVTWIGPDALRDRELHDHWCDAVGPPVLELEPGEVPEPADTIAIVVWNVHVGGGDVGLLIDRLKSGALTDGRPVRTFVLLLQETYRSGSGVPIRPPAGSQGPVAILSRPEKGERRSAPDVARDNRLSLFYVPSMRNAGMIDPKPAAEDRGNAILATLPLADPLAIELPFERQRRVAVAATVAGTTVDRRPWTLTLASVHLDTSLALTRGGPAAARRRQADALIDAIGSGERPTIVGGDFNTWLGDQEPAMRDLRAAFPDTPRDRLPATWRGPLGTRFLLDHIFAKDLHARVTVRRLADRFGSDHYPLLAMVELELRGGSVGAGGPPQLGPSSASSESGSTRPPFARTAQ